MEKPTTNARRKIKISARGKRSHDREVTGPVVYLGLRQVRGGVTPLSNVHPGNHVLRPAAATTIRGLLQPEPCGERM